MLYLLSQKTHVYYFINYDCDVVCLHIILVWKSATLQRLTYNHADKGLLNYQLWWILCNLFAMCYSFMLYGLAINALHMKMPFS